MEPAAPERESIRGLPIFLSRRLCIKYYYPDLRFRELTVYGTEKLCSFKSPGGERSMNYQTILN